MDRVRRAFVLYATGSWSDTALADELGLTEPGLAEILTNPLYAGRVIRHKGHSDEEERAARYEAPMDPALFERVLVIRAERRTRHPGGIAGRRPYPLAGSMRCIHCGSTYHGDAKGMSRSSSGCSHGPPLRRGARCFGELPCATAASPPLRRRGS